MPMLVVLFTIKMMTILTLGRRDQTRKAAVPRIPCNSYSYLNLDPWRRFSCQQDLENTHLVAFTLFHSEGHLRRFDLKMMRKQGFGWCPFKIWSFLLGTENSESESDKHKSLEMASEVSLRPMLPLGASTSFLKMFKNRQSFICVSPYIHKVSVTFT